MTQEQGTGGVKRGHAGHDDDKNGGDMHDGGGGDGVADGVDLFFIERLMSGPAAAAVTAVSEPPGGKTRPRDIAAIMSDSGSAFDDGMMVPESTAGLRRRRGQNGNKRGAERMGER